MSIVCFHLLMPRWCGPLHDDAKLFFVTFECQEVGILSDFILSLFYFVCSFVHPFYVTVTNLTLKCNLTLLSDSMLNGIKSLILWGDILDSYLNYLCSYYIYIICIYELLLLYVYMNLDRWKLNCSVYFSLFCIILSPFLFQDCFKFYEYILVFRPICVIFLIFV